MSRFRVVWPDGSESGGVALEEPQILPFPGDAAVARRLPLDALSRARALFANRCCPDCGYPVVEPLELDDAMLNRSGMPIPGTATLIGFRCADCAAEWSA